MKPLIPPAAGHRARFLGSWLTWVAATFIVAATAGAAQAQVVQLPDAVFTQNLRVDIDGTGRPDTPCFPWPDPCKGEGSSGLFGFFFPNGRNGALASFYSQASPVVLVAASAWSRGFGVANAFSDVVFVLSAGISNDLPVIGPPVPEPETWTLMLVALAGLGMARRIRLPSPPREGVHTKAIHAGRPVNLQLNRL